MRPRVILSYGPSRQAAIAFITASVFLAQFGCHEGTSPPPEETAEGGGGATVEELVTCTIAGVEYEPGAQNPEEPCEFCDPLNPKGWTTDPSTCDPEDPEDPDDVDRCPDGFPRGNEGDVRLVQEFSPALEGLAVCPNGDVFVSQPETATIFRVPLDGSAPEVWTTLEGHQPLGMDCGSDGVLYVADFGSKDSSVFRIAAQDDPGTPLPKVPGSSGYRAMNGVAAVEGVGIYATDASNTLGGRIILFTETSPDVFEARVVKSGLPFPNDVAFNPSTGTLDVTMTVNSQVFSYPVEPDGALGSRQVTWSGTLLLDAIDGLAVAEGTDRYIARYLQGKVSRSSDWQVVAGMAEPKSLAFRGGTLFITAKKGLYAVDLAVCGAPR